MTKIQLPRRAKITLLSIGGATLLLTVISALYVAFSPSPRMSLLRQRWRETAAAPVCQDMMEVAACSGFRGRVLDCKGRVMACLETRYDLYFDCCAAGDEKWSKSVPELAQRLAYVLPYRTQGQWLAYLENGRKFCRRYLLIAKNLDPLERMMLPLMSAGNFEGGVAEPRRIATYPNGDVGRRVLGYYRETAGRGVGIIGDNYDSLCAGEDICTTLDSRWQQVADGMLRNGSADLARRDDVMGVCMVVGDLHSGDVKVMINLLKDRPNHFSEDYNFALGFRYAPAPHFARKYMTYEVISELNAIDGRYQAVGGDSLQVSPMQLLACLSRSVNGGRMVAPRLLPEELTGTAQPEAHESVTPFPDKSSMATFDENGLVGSLGISRQEIDRGHLPAVPVYCHSFAGMWTARGHEYGIVCMILSKRKSREHLEATSMFASAFSDCSEWLD